MSKDAPVKTPTHAYVWYEGRIYAQAIRTISEHFVFLKAKQLGMPWGCTSRQPRARTHYSRIEAVRSELAATVETIRSLVETIDEERTILQELETAEKSLARKDSPKFDAAKKKRREPWD